MKATRRTHWLIFLSLLWLSTAVHASADVLFTLNGLEYSYIIPSRYSIFHNDPIDSTVVMVCGYETPDNFNSKQPLRIPGSVTHNGKTYQVKEIGDDALGGILSVKEIIVEEGIEKIGGGAFSACYYLESLYLPASVKEIETYLLFGCYNLKKVVVDPKNKYYDSRDNCNAIIDTKYNTLVAACANSTIPSSVKGIGGGAFAGFTNLEKFVIPEGIEYIWCDAFACCNNLKEIKLPESLRKINRDAFRNCNSLTSIFIPKNVKTVLSGSFSGCNNLTSIVVDKENKYYDSRLDCNGIIRTEDSTLIVACKTTRLVESILDLGSPFEGVSVHSIRFPKSVEEIHGFNLFGCRDVESLSVDPENPKYISPEGSNAILTKDGKVLVLGCRTTIIPAGVEEIGPEAFDNRCSDIVLALPEGLKKIKDSAFAYNKMTALVIIPSTVTEIEENAFGNCENLQAVQFLAPIEEIAPFTFHSCKKLSVINIPEGVKTIGSRAFQYCENLKNIHLPSTLEKIEEDAFEGCPCEESVKQFLNTRNLK